MLQFSITARNAVLDGLQYGGNAGETTGIGASAIIKFFTGGPPADCAAADTGTKIAEFDLGSSWAAAASAGAKTLASLPLSIPAVAAGTVGHFRIFASDGTTCHMQGAITGPGGGGDMIADNPNMASGQNVNITGFTLAAPGA
jgi:hypothetical protein